MGNSDNINDNVDSVCVSNSYQCSPELCKKIIVDNHHQRTFKIFHINIRSINCNIDETQILLARINCDCDLLIFTECWLSVTPITPIINGYDSYRSGFRNQNDGVVLYSKSNINATVTEPKLTHASCLLFTQGNKVAVLAIYRSPAEKNLDPFLDSLNDLLNSLSAYQTVTIIGDMNLNILPDNKDKFADLYLNIISSQGMLPAHMFPTRDETCLDHVILRTRCQATCFVIENTVTDHAANLLCLEPSSKAVSKQISSLSRLDYPAIVEQLKNSDFSHIYKLQDANLAMEAIIGSISTIILNNKRTVVVSRRKNVVKPWITLGLLKCIRNRDRLHAKYKLDPNNYINKTIYLRYRNFCNNLLKRLKRQYEKTEFQRARGNPKETWKTIKKVANIQQSPVSASTLIDQSMDPIISTNKVNDYFVGVGSELANNIITSSSNHNVDFYSSEETSCYDTMALFETDCAEVERIVRGLRRDCAIGWDGIPSRLLIDTSDILVPPLTHIFNQCLSSGIFPKCLKRALVLPVFKSGDRASVHNYRPISILTSLSKILEKLLNSRLIKHLNKNKILSDRQYGFRKGLSTENAVLDLTNNIIHHLEAKSKTIGIFLDLSKAFDTVSVPKLVAKMEKLGIRGLAMDMYQSYLTDRSQCVKIDDHLSDDKLLSFGVPQGSILGPILFIIYINELCLLKIPFCEVFTYADDTALIVTGQTWCEAERHAHQALNIVMSWLSSNLLTLNTDKTKYITFSPNIKSQPDSPSVKIVAHKCQSQTSDNCDCISLTRTNNIRYLGVNIDSTLNWKTHIDNLVSRTKRLIYIFKNLRSSADKDTLKTVYLSLAQSVLSYCDTAWGGACTANLLPLERAQRSILKVMLKKPIRYNTYALYKDADVLSVRQLFLLHTIIRRHKLLHYNSDDDNPRRRSRVCHSVTCRTELARRHHEVFANFIYNKINKLVNIYPLPTFKVRTVIIEFLKKLSYEDTEQLIRGIV